jgi:hypothetical protein
MGDLGLLILLLIADSPVDATECCHPYCSSGCGKKGPVVTFGTRDWSAERQEGGVGSSGVRKSGAIYARVVDAPRESPRDGETAQGCGRGKDDRSVKGALI